MVQATISLAFAILAEAGLSFLGLGAQPPQSSWGLMIQASRDYLDVAPWTGLVPGAAVALTSTRKEQSASITGTLRSRKQELTDRISAAINAINRGRVVDA